MSEARKNFIAACSKAFDEMLKQVKQDIASELLDKTFVRKTRRYEAKLSAERMRCKFVDKGGHRCKERSKGPRFQYLCEKHIDKKS